MNHSDAERMETILQGLGLQATDKREEADLIIITTCSVRQSAEDRVYGLAHNFAKLRRKNPNLLIGITGCMAGRDTDGKIRQRLSFVNFFFPIHEAWKVFQFSLTEKEASTVGEIVGYAKIILSVFDPGRWLLVGEYLYTYVVTPWGTIFAVFIISTILMLILRKLRKFFLSFFITFTLLGVLVLGTFAFSIGYAGTLAIGDAAKRLSMLFYPLFIFCIALVMQELVKIKK